MENRDFIQNAPDAFIQFSSTLRLIDLNPAAEELFGIGQEKACDSAIDEFFAGIYDNTDEFKRVIENGIPFSINDLPLPGRKSSRISLKAFKSGNGLGIIAGDQSELRYVIDEIREFNQFIRQVVAGANICMIVFDSQGGIVIWNKAAEDLTGYALDEVLSGTAWEEMSPKKPNSECFADTIRAVLENGRILSGEEISLRTKSRDTKIVEFHARRILDDDNEPLGVVALGIDVTRRKRLEKQLLHSQKMEALGNLAGGVAHDFNNLLTVILGDTELAADYLDEDHPVTELLTDISDTSKRANELTRQLLLFSRRQPGILKTININLTLANLMKMLQRVLTRRIEVTFTQGESLWPVFADETHVEQAVINICLNAKEAQSNGGRICISTSNAFISEEQSANLHHNAYAGDFVILTIRDDGPGIPEEDIHKIFDPFYSTKGQGNGLGLAVVYGIIKDLKGWICVRNHKENGAVFDIYLPAYFEKQEAPAPLPEQMPEIEEEHVPRILLVEPEESVGRSVHHSLEGENCEFAHAQTEADARALFEEVGGEIDLLITETVLENNKSGFQLARDFSLTSPALKVLFTTSSFQSNEIQDQIRKAGYSVLPKPFTRSSLLDTVKKLIDKQSSE